MLYQKYFGLPMWVWLIVISVISFSIYQILSKKSTIGSKDEVKSKEEFTESSNTKPKVMVYNFNTEWCGWSKRFQPEWDKFTEMTKTNNKLSFIEARDIKCDNKENENMCEQYNVPGYPYVIFEVNGKRIPYEGERTAQALVEHFLNL